MKTEELKMKNEELRMKNEELRMKSEVAINSKCMKSIPDHQQHHVPQNIAQSLNNLEDNAFCQFRKLSGAAVEEIKPAVIKVLSCDLARQKPIRPYHC